MVISLLQSKQLHFPAEKKPVKAAAHHPKLEVELSNYGPQPRLVLHSTVPNGFAVVENEVFEGKKIIATRGFKKDDLLYIGKAALMDLSITDHHYKLNFLDNNDTHSVDDFANSSKSGSTSKRQVYGWDAFMNHSCEANAYFPLLHRTSTEMYYQAIALRDIEAGEEVTCDYALFDYECNGHQIEVCACGSKKCRGKMYGFQALDLNEKVEILHLVDDEIKDLFFAHENIAVFQSLLPQGVDLSTEDDGVKSLVATRNIEAGDVVFKNRAHLVPQHDLECNKKFLLEMRGRFHLLDSENHFIHRGEYAEMPGFDVFMDHSCSPNTRQVYADRENYVMYASKIIRPGEKITCDYMALNNDAVGAANTGTLAFECSCGEANCKGVIVA
ncbi:hypothetical protein ACHAWF_005965 [Thalassiosira exigua]